MARKRGLLGLAIFLALAVDVWAQDPRAPAGGRGDALGAAVPGAYGKIVVRVRDEGGAPLSTFAVVRLFSEFTSFHETAGTAEASEAVFGSVPLGEYQVEVSAPGYQIAKQEASLLAHNSSTYVYVDLRPEGVPGAAPPSGPPLLAPKAQKELESGVAAIRAGDLAKAQKHLDKAKQLAPQHPDVHYVQGLLYLRQENLPLAQASFERAVTFYPDHAAAHGALGTVLYRETKFQAAIGELEKAVRLQPTSWQAHQVLALCFLQEQSFEQALTHAERALEISGNKAPELHLLLARALMARKQFVRAEQEISVFMQEYPKHAGLPEAKRLLADLRRETAAAQAPPSSAAVSPAAAANSSADSPRESAPSPASAGKDTASSLPLRAAPAVPEPPRLAPGRWAPPSVDETQPVLIKNAACKLPEVLSGAGKRATALAKNLEQITTTESIEHADLDENGSPHSIKTNVFYYLVNVVEWRPGNLSMEEDRIPIRRSDTPPQFVVKGMGALALIFHPYYVGDFDMRCEGLTEVNGQAAWSVYFKQRADVPSRMRSYQVRGRNFEVALKGRAWIAANNFQVLRLETDLVEPVKLLRLDQEHMVIEYKPVDFKSRKVRLWLPANAQMYALYRGRRFQNHHSFTDYKVFSVDVSQKISEKTP